VLYAVSCLTKFSGDVRLLVFGRVCSGIATSLLYSVFEAWMIAEHDRQGATHPMLQCLSINLMRTGGGSPLP
jgi:hypothetical protein